MYEREWFRRDPFTPSQEAAGADLAPLRRAAPVYDPCTVMFFYRNKHIMIDLSTGNNNKMSVLAAI